jgi:hypothetical protein
MSARVGPGVHQILGTQVRVGSQQGLLEGAVRLPAGADRRSQGRLENTFREMAEFSD